MAASISFANIQSFSAEVREHPEPRGIDPFVCVRFTINNETDSLMLMGSGKVAEQLRRMAAAINSEVTE